MPLTIRFDEAFRYAHDLHRAQRRKGTSVPYVAHLMSVAALVIEHGGDEDQAIAALLHDAPEDQGGVPVLREIERRFGEDVARIVADCTELLDGSQARLAGAQGGLSGEIAGRARALAAGVAGGQDPQRGGDPLRLARLGRGGLAAIQRRRRGNALVLWRPRAGLFAGDAGPVGRSAVARHERILERAFFSEKRTRGHNILIWNEIFCCG